LYGESLIWKALLSHPCSNTDIKSNKRRYMAPDTTGLLFYDVNSRIYT